MHRWFARVQGNLDDCRGHLLSAGLNEFLASTRALGTESVTVSFGQCGHACSVRHSLVARAEALELLQRAMESNPNNVVTHNNLGYGLLVAGRLNDSLEHLQRALEIDPNYSGAHANMANTLLQIGRTDEALFHLRKTLELDPGDSEAQKNMAWFLATSPIAHPR